MPGNTESASPMARKVASYRERRSSTLTDCADPDAELEAHAGASQTGDLGVDHRIGQAVIRDAVAQDSASGVIGIEDGDVVPVAPQLAGAGQARGTGSDDRHPAMAGGFRRRFGAVGTRPLGHEPLDRPNRNRALGRCPLA